MRYILLAKYFIIIVSSIFIVLVFSFLPIIIEVNMFRINQKNPLWTLFVIIQTVAMCLLSIVAIIKVNENIFNEYEN
jgi:glycerol-3-phosphate acyltransferase PlsY